MRPLLLVLVIMAYMFGNKINVLPVNVSRKNGVSNFLNFILLFLLYSHFLRGICVYFWMNCMFV